MNVKLLKLLASKARTSVEDIAVMLDMRVEDVAKEMDEMEKEGVIRAYKAVVDWERVDTTAVTALIQLSVSPKAGLGFEEVAKKVMNYPEVETVYLMSGGYDLCVMVRGKTFQEVAMFVAKRLSTIDSVLSTATHFVLRRYKENDVVLIGKETDERENLV
ncbi:MAG: Lrp/AsnC family transcriptional regulator [Clostridia bacterium]|nr:Lrp/AsnC family transcriptional regulator [Clostridia bacterium]MBQ1942138.1 Lrp/AsnC family transcriptional regulator [Clostridia bacterium]MBQ5801934.1 Lrp/AsnC family transcriptional regulator [Clostridia bacterium]